MRNTSLEELNANEVLLDSMLFRMIQLSENAKRLSEEYKQSHGNIPWNALYGLNDAKACVVRELNEELGLQSEDIEGLSLRYIALRHTKKLNIAIRTPRKALEIGDYSKEIIYEVEVERIRQDVADIAEVIEILGNIKKEIAK